MIARLARDERGAIALMAVFMAIVLIGALAYVEGIGASVLRREQLQDAADAVAFSSAVQHARGMNVLALLNTLMAALLAVLVTLKLIEVLTAIAIVAISAMAFFFPAALGVIPPLGALKKSVADVHTTLSPGVHTAIEALHVAGVGVRTLVPAASVGASGSLAGSQPDSPATLGFVVPTRLTLPTENGPFSQICDHAGDYVSDLTHWIVDATPLPGEAARIVAEATEDLVKSRADWFCGDGGASPPKTTVTQRHRYPSLPERTRCEALHPDVSNYDPQEHGEVCQAAEDAEDASEPDDEGNCAGPAPSAATGDSIECDDSRHPYHLRAWLARRDCSPEADDDERGPLKAFEYQVHRFRRQYRFERGKWRIASTAAEEQRDDKWLHRKDVTLRPCGRRGAPIASRWNDGHDFDGGLAQQPPVCSDVSPPEAPGHEGQLDTITHREVTRVFGCMRKEKRRHEVDSSEGGGAARPEQEVPQRVLAGAALGDEPFQIRAGVVGSPLDASGTGLLELAAFRWLRGPQDQQQPEPQEPAQTVLATQLGRIAVAQAEYYYDGPAKTDPAHYLWSMRWRARLRRFTWQSADARPDAGVAGGDALTFDAGAFELSLDAACETALALARVDAELDLCAQLRELSAVSAH